MPDPTPSQMVENFAEAVKEWAGAGFAVASRETAMARGSTCGQCDLWDAAARLGLGKCNSPKCGCTMLKWFLASSRCPEGKWKE